MTCCDFILSSYCASQGRALARELAQGTASALGAALLLAHPPAASMVVQALPPSKVSGRGQDSAAASARAADSNSSWQHRLCIVNKRRTRRAFASV